MGNPLRLDTRLLPEHEREKKQQYYFKILVPINIVVGDKAAGKITKLSIIHLLVQENDP